MNNSSALQLQIQTLDNHSNLSTASSESADLVFMGSTDLPLAPDSCEARDGRFFRWPEAN